MSTAELKTEILKLVVETEDTSILIKVKAYFKSLKKSETADWWDELSEEDKIDIQQAEKEIKQGKTISHQKAKSIIGKIVSGK